MADLNIDTITDTARDAAYVAIGAGVIAFQKLQVQRVELTKTVSAQLDEAKDSANDSLATAKGNLDNVTDLVEGQLRQIEGRLSDVETRMESLLSQLEVKLPEQAQDIVKQARDLVGRAA